MRHKMQDREQKQNMLKYIVFKKWFPQVELIVTGEISNSRSKLHITDIDVLASIPDEFEAFRNILVDCKTLKKEKPIARVLWQKGLMDKVNASYGICLLKKDEIVDDHRYVASELKIRLMTEEEFGTFLNSTIPASFNFGAISDIILWERYCDIPDRFPKLLPAILFSKQVFWNSDSMSQACRRSIGLSKRLRPELDPMNNLHFTVFADIVSLFLYSLSHIVYKIFSGYFLPKTRENLSEALLLLLYEGRENYEFQNNLRKLIIRKSEKKIADLSLPMWEDFLQLVRHSLDSPQEIVKTPLMLREIGWKFLDEESKYSDKYLISILNDSPSGVKIAAMATEYICKASNLPPEFKEKIIQKLFMT